MSVVSTVAAVTQVAGILCMTKKKMQGAKCMIYLNDMLDVKA